MMDENQALLQYNGTTNNDLYAQSIIDYRAHRLDEAFKKLDTLIQQEPDNPYLYELKNLLNSSICFSIFIFCLSI